MARIPDEELERLKRDFPLQHLVEAHGVALKPKGKDLVGCCPFHADDTASLVVSTEKNLFHCFGCGAAGSVIDWAMKTGNISFRHAVEILRKSSAARMPGVTTRVLESPVTMDADDTATLDQVTEYYHSTLKESPEALAYLEKRGLRSSEMIEKFKLGFSNRTLGLRLPLKNRNAGAELRGRLQKLGIIRESGHEHFVGSVVTPILDLNGHTVGMYGRKIGDNLRPGTPLHMYLPGPHRGIFNEQALVASTDLVLCESICAGSA